MKKGVETEKVTLQQELQQWKQKCSDQQEVYAKEIQALRDQLRAHDFGVFYMALFFRTDDYRCYRFLDITEAVRAAGEDGPIDKESEPEKYERFLEIAEREGLQHLSHNAGQDGNNNNKNNDDINKKWLLLSVGIGVGQVHACSKAIKRQLPSPWFPAKPGNEEQDLARYKIAASTPAWDLTREEMDVIGNYRERAYQKYRQAHPEEFTQTADDDD
jgi:hypothetical protein